MKPLRFALIGTGFWSQFQLAAWRELKGANCVALCDRSRKKAEALGRRFRITTIYDNPQELLTREKLDFVDLVTDVATHAPLTRLAAQHGVAVICQKPMARSLREATATVEFCRRRKIPFFIHENFRWQAPLRTLKATLDRGTIGRPF